MKVILTILGVLIGLLAGAWIVGSMLPRDHVASSQITLPHPPDSVWAIVRDPSALVGTWPDLAQARRVDDPAGREIWEEKVSGFDMRFIIEESTPPSRLMSKLGGQHGSIDGYLRALGKKLGTEVIPRHRNP